MEANPRDLSTLPVSLEEVYVKDINDAGRSRTSYQDMEGLKISLKQKGLINPIALMKYEKKYSGFTYFLLAGGRRLKAVKELKWEKVPARIYPHGLNGYEIRIIELEENIRREDLTDAERIKMTKQVHDLYVSLYGEKTSTSVDAPGHSYRDTAKKLNISVGKVGGDLEIAKWLEEIPELEKLRGRKEIKQAIAQAKKKVRRNRALELITDDPLSKGQESLEDAYHVGDFFELSKSIPDSSTDLVDLDIDYPMDVAEMHPGVGRDKKSGVYTAVTKEDYPELLQKALQESYRILNTDSWCLVWFGMEYFSDIQKWAADIGFKVGWYYADWFKGEGYSHCRNPKYNLRHSKEHFFYLKKGSPEIQKPHSDTFEESPNVPAQRVHPYEKPARLMLSIFETFIPEESRIVSPFAGGGNTLIAGAIHKCSVWGSDLSEEYKKGYVLKVRELTMKGKFNK